MAATSGNLTADAKAAWEELLMDFNISMAQIGYPSSNNSLFLEHGSAASALGTTIIPIVDVDEGIIIWNHNLIHRYTYYDWFVLFYQVMYSPCPISSLEW